MKKWFEDLLDRVDVYATVFGVLVTLMLILLFIGMTVYSWFDIFFHLARR